MLRLQYYYFPAANSADTERTGGGGGGGAWRVCGPPIFHGSRFSLFAATESHGYMILLQKRGGIKVPYACNLHDDGSLGLTVTSRGTPTHGCKPAMKVYPYLHPST